MMKCLVETSVQKPAEKQNDSSLEDYLEFCDLFDKDPLLSSARKVQECVLVFFFAATIVS